MAPKLYYYSVSPPCRAVLMVAKAIGLELDLEEKHGEDLKTDEMLELNPQHTVPTLVDEDEDFTIWESHAIVGYLIGQYAGEDDSMYPKGDVKKLALINQRLHFENSVLSEKAKACLLPLFMGEQIPEDASDALLEALGFLESFLNGKQWFAGDELTVADLSLLATLATIEAVGFPIDPERFPQLCDWLVRAKELPYFEECNREGLEKAKEMVFQN